jgi:CheY-like chemotaxis protein
MSKEVKVLVVDDDAGMRSTTVEILGQAGYAVREAWDGNVALERLAEEMPDVLLLDVRMPERDGISVLETMNPEPPPPDVVLVSAYAIDAESRQRLGTKVDQYLRKPVPPKKLLEAVSDAASQAAFRQGRG